MYHQRAGFPDLAALVEIGNPDLLKHAVVELDAKMKALLKSHGVPLNTFDTLEAFQSYVQSK